VLVRAPTADSLMLFDEDRDDVSQTLPQSATLLRRVESLMESGGNDDWIVIIVASAIPIFLLPYFTIRPNACPKRALEVIL